MTTAGRPGARAVVSLRRLDVALTALLVVAYVLVLGGLCVLVLNRLSGGEPSRPAIWTLVVAAAVVAATVAPVQRWVRDGVAGVLASTETPESPSLAALQARDGDGPTAHLAAMASTVREVLDAAAVEIVVHPSAAGGSWSGARATVGRSSNPWAEMALVYAGRDHGVLRVSPRRASSVGRDDLRLLPELARHVGLVVSSAVLREELEASREALVIAREEERRRIRRDLHDGLGPSLAAIKLEVAATRRQFAAVGQDPATLDQLRAMVRDATDEVRRVIEDLRPPLLDDCGLVDSLRNLRFVPPELAWRVDAPSPLPPLPAAVEVALYRIASEAVHNATRHAAASWCTATIDVDADQVTLTVEDDGRGMPEPRPSGVGTAAMLERAGELGGSLMFARPASGGTLVTARLPIRGGAIT